MTEARTPPRDRTRLLLAVAGLLAVVTAGVYLAGYYAEARDAMAAEMELKEAQYLKLARVVQSGRQIEETHKALTAFHAQLVQRRFITAATTPLAEARLQTIIADLAKANGLTIRSSRGAPVNTEDRQEFLNLSINASGEIGAIRDFLLQLSDNPTFILLKQVEIRQISAREKRNYFLNIQLAAPMASGAAGNHGRDDAPGERSTS